MSKTFLYAIVLTCMFTGVLLANEGKAQHKSIHEVFISLELDNAAIKDVLDVIEEQTDFKFVYSGETDVLTNDQRITLKVDNKSVAFVLKQIAGETGFIFQQNDGLIGIGTQKKRKQNSLKTSKEALPERIITGKVTDETGEPLAGVNIVMKGTTIGTMTDVDGKYVISVSDNATTLVFSYIGYSKTEATIGGRSVIDITMQLDVTSLAGVTVSTGYWETDERLNPGNIAKINSEEIESQPIANPLQAMQGRMPGVYIQQASGLPGGGFFIQIRGQNSLRVLGNDPLYIVDGVPFAGRSIVPTSVNRASSIINPLNSINPADIESIEVLKDADATAIYGSRGANGVVLITTKKGTPGKTKFQFDFSRGFSEVAEKLDLLNTQQYLEMRREAIVNDGFDDPNFQQFFPDVFAWDTTRYTDWQETLLGDRSDVTNASVSVSGGTNNTQFLFRGSYYKETLVYPGDYDYQRGSGHINLNHKTEDNKFRLSVSSTFTTDKNVQPNADFVANAITLAPNAPPIYDSLGQINWENGTFNNPFAATEIESESQTDNFITNAVLSYFPINGMEVKSNIGYNTLKTQETLIRPLTSFNPIQGRTSGSGRFANSKANTWIVEPQISYQREIGDGSLKILAGTTFQETIEQNESVAYVGVASDALLRDPSSASISGITETNYIQYRYSSVYGRINYNWKEKYILNLTARRDASSRFGSGNQTGDFGAVGAAWIFSNEGFIQNSLPILSFGKLRVSYGSTGSDQIGNYQFLDTYEGTAFPYQGNPGLVPTRISNPNYSWETNKKLELGLELGLFDDRIFLIGSWYRNRSSDQLIGLPLSLVAGFSSVQANFPATVENQGWEFEVLTTNIQTNNFKWSTAINLTIPRNELIEFPNIEETAFNNSLKVGRSLFTVFGRVFDGVDRETGTYVFEDIDRNDNAPFNPDFPGDFRHLEERIQEYFGGVQNTISYMNIHLEFLFQFVKQTGDSYLDSFFQPGAESNQPTIVMNRWQGGGDITTIQRFGLIGDSQRAYLNVRGSNQNVVDASFIRLKNVRLSYSLPSDLLGKAGIQETQIYLQGQNLLTFSDYLGLDPENTNSRVLPPLRTISAGINLSF